MDFFITPHWKAEDGSHLGSPRGWERCHRQGEVAYGPLRTVAGRGGGNGAPSVLVGDYSSHHPESMQIATPG